jgi:rhamnogalacturonan I rhamnosyltransferase
MGFRKTIALDRKKLVELLDLFQGRALSWDEFSGAVKEAHKSRTGQPTDRKAIPGQPKEEDYFYANPQECLGSSILTARPGNPLPMNNGASTTVV